MLGRKVNTIDVDRKEHYKSVKKSTMFFRHRKQVPIRRIITEAFDEPNVRILSLPCSTGQEPYSLAMELFDIDKIEIFGADADECVIDRARNGEYELRNGYLVPYAINRLELFNIIRFSNFRIVPSLLRNTSLLELNFTVPKSLKNRVSFYRHNILDGPTTTPGGHKYNVVLCMNLLSPYFEEGYDYANRLKWDDSFTKAALRNIRNSITSNGIVILDNCPARYKDAARIRSVNLKPDERFSDIRDFGDKPMIYKRR